MAYPKFKVGEMVITQHATYFTEFDGSLGVVIYPLQRKLCMDLNLMERVPADVYGVKLLLNGEPRFWLRPWQLRMKVKIRLLKSYWKKSLLPVHVFVKTRWMHAPPCSLLPRKRWIFMKLSVMK